MSYEGRVINNDKDQLLYYFFSKYLHFWCSICYLIKHIVLNIIPINIFIHYIHINQYCILSWEDNCCIKIAMLWINYYGLTGFKPILGSHLLWTKYSCSLTNSYSELINIKCCLQTINLHNPSRIIHVSYAAVILVIKIMVVFMLTFNTL